MIDDADLGPAPHGFPATDLSLLQAVGSGDELIRRRAFEALVSVYWKPAYIHFRLRWRADVQEAEDLTQAFFAEAMDPAFFEGYAPERARFRTFLRGCLDHFVANARRAERRLKRGGGARVLPLDFEGAETEFVRAGAFTDAEPDARFHAEWVRALLTVAVEALRAECMGTPREIRFQLFARCDLEAAAGDQRPTYQQLAEGFDLPVTQVTNHLAWARREFRRHVLQTLRSLTGSDAEFREEARELLGVDPS